MHEPAPANPRICALLALTAVLSLFLWQVLTVHYNFARNWTALFWTGELHRLPPDLSAGTYVFKGSDGYDGQFYRYVAHDPFFTRGYSKFIDNPQFRYRRMLVPVAAWVLALGNGRWIDGAFDAVVLLSIFGGLYWSARWVVQHGQPAAWGLVFLIVPSTITSVDRMLTDATLTACFAGFLWYTETRNRWAVYAVSAAAFLTRDTGVLLIAAAVIGCLMQRAYRRAACFATAAIPTLGWYVFVWLHVRNVQPWESIAWPLAGIAQRLVQVRHYGDPLIEKLLQALDLVALAGLVAAIVMVLVIVAPQKKGPVQICVALFAVMGMCFGRPVMADAYAFGRAISPLLLFLLLQAAIGWRAALAPPLMILASVGTMSVTPAWRILQGICGLR